MDDLRELLDDFSTELRARNRAPGTIDLYRRHVLAFTGWLEAAGLPTDATRVTRAHLRDYVTDLLTRPNQRTGKPLSATYAHGQYRSLQQFFGYLDAEDIIDADPFTKMSPPTVVEAPVPIPTVEDLQGMLKACAGTSYPQRRDSAVIRLLVDTGMRIGELAGLTVDDLDFGEDTAVVLGKGRRPRTVPFGGRTRTALRHYLRLRAAHPGHDMPALWLGSRGPMTGGGIQQMIESRARQAGIGHIHPHQLRHFFAHHWLAEGGQEQDLMMLLGWRSRQMLARYGANAATARARSAHRRMRPGDRL